MNALSIDPAHVAQKIERFLKEHASALRREGAILGVSGGLDSALVATLAVRAFGPEAVLALLLPERDSSPDSERDALVVIRQLGISHKKIDQAPMLSALGIYKRVPLQLLRARRIKAAVVRQQHDQHTRALGELPFLAGLLGTRGLSRQRTLDAGQAYARAKHRMRLVTLYFHAELENRIVLGTTNKSEAMSGFVVKWGDNVADVEPILPLYKTQVRELARYLGVPEAIIDKAPSPDLLPGITDEYALGMSYHRLDQILSALENGHEPQAIADELQIESSQVGRVRELVRRSAHMREWPPMPRL